MKLGAYTVDTELGAGGMGTVYLARDAADNKVAVKVVHPHLMTLPGVFKRFLREAEVGKQVVNENVVRTLDVDSVEGSHFLVMEYVEGQTLRELLVEMETVPEELCRHIGREVGKALEGIHGAGIIHRDLKPENVLITDDHVVKVMDLGLARMQDEAARLSRAGEFAGSVHYAAPEQFTLGGENLDGRADLYALGIMLYELATGRHPFGEGELAAVMHKQLNEQPRDPAEVNPQLSPFLCELIAGLLHKDRDERFDSAQSIGSILAEGEDSAWWRRRSGEIVKRTQQPLRRIRIPRETALYGREAQLAALRKAFDEGGVVLLQGEAGVGKTRLVDEFVSSLEEDVHFLFGTSPPGGAATAAGAFVDAYESIRARLAEILPGSPLRPGFEALLEQSGDAPLSREGMQAAFARTTLALAEEMPTVVLIDDLHFAPEEGRALFASLASAVAGQRVLLVGTLRPGVPEDWLGELERLPHVTLVDVPRLGPADLHALLEDALRSRRLAEQLGGQIAWKSDGNPFFVFEILQELRTEGLLKEEGGSIVKTQIIKDLRVPSSLRDLILARIAHLDEEDRTILEVAACDGYEFDPTLVGEALGMARIPLLRRLGGLEKSLRLVHATGRRFRFDHHQVQEALYDGLGELLREEYHATLGDMLEQRDGDPIALCEHFLKGGRGERAQPHLAAALAQLKLGHRTTAALDLASRALAVPDLLTGAERANVLEHKGSAFNVLGRYDEAAAVFEEMRAATDDPFWRHTAAVLLSNLYVNLARYDDAIAICREILETGRTEGNGEAIIGGAIIMANALMYQGRWEECQAAYEEARAVPGDFDDAMARVGPTGNLGWARGCAGRYREALELSDEAMTLVGENAWGRSINLGYRIAYFRDLGLYDEALEIGTTALETARSMGYRWGEATALQELGGVAEETGDADEARERYEAALEIRREIGYAAGVAETLASLGRLTGDRAMLENARDLGRKLGTPTPFVIASAYLGEDVAEWLPRARRRQAIEAAFVLGDTETAREILAGLDVPDGVALDKVPLYTRVLT